MKWLTMLAKRLGPGARRGQAAAAPKARLAARNAPAARSPLAEHEDDLSPARALRESVGASGSQRVGNSSPVANPDTSFPGEEQPPHAA